MRWRGSQYPPVRPPGAPGAWVAAPRGCHAVGAVGSMAGCTAGCGAGDQDGPWGEPWGGRAGGGGNAAGGGERTIGAVCGRPGGGSCRGGCTLAFFLGGWPCSGGEERRVPSARCDRSVTDTHPAAVMTGIRARVWSPATARHTASKQGMYSYPRSRLSSGICRVDPRWARRASRTAAVVIVSGLGLETSTVSWREAGEPIRVSGGGGGGGAGPRPSPARETWRPGPGAGAPTGLAGVCGLG